MFHVTPGAREATGALILAVVREGGVIASPEAWFVLQEKDTILVSGAGEQVAEVESLVSPDPRGARSPATGS